jgi:hypothetical protein
MAVFAQSNCSKKNSGNSRLAGYVTPDARWPNAQASVCWENPEAVDSKYLEFAENRVISEFNNRTIFKFSTGWKKCTSTSRGIRILLVDSADRFVRSFGVGLDGLENGVQLNFSFIETKWDTCQGDNLYFCIGDDVLHEMGHAIGLRHEGNRRDSPCQWDQTSGRGEQGAVPLGSYDVHSIMNYCATTFNQRNQLAVLSEDDIKTIDRYYSMTDEELLSQAGPVQCEANGDLWDFEQTCCISNSGNLVSSGMRNYDYCEKDFLISFPSIDIKSRFVTDTISMTSQSGEKVENVEPESLILRCREGGREFFASGRLATENLQQGTAFVSFPEGNTVYCDLLTISANINVGMVGANSSSADDYSYVRDIYQLSFPLQSLRVGSDFRVNGNWKLTEYNPIGSETVISSISVKINDNDAMVSGTNAALICDAGRYMGNISNGKATFFPETNANSRGARIACNSIEAYPQGSKRSSGSYYRLTFPKAAYVMAGSERSFDMSQARFIQVKDGAYPVCSANGGRGYGNPFKCGNTDCAKKTLQAAQSNDEAGWCLFRPSDTL